VLLGFIGTYDTVTIDYVAEVEGMKRMESKIQFFQEKISLEDPIYVENQLKGLLRKEILSVEDLEEWLATESELSEAIEEVLSGDYIAFQRYNNDEVIKKRFEHDQQVIMPLVKKYSALFDQKFYDSPFRSKLDQDKYKQLIRSRVNAIELYREENIKLEVEEDKLHNEYFEITGSMTVIWEGEEKTLPQMREYVQSSEREVREKAWKLVASEINKNEDRLNAIMSELISIRHKKAQNAGLDNYRDYMFKKYERFDYTPEDCYTFHEAVKKAVVPMVTEIQKQHQQELGVDKYKPWDTQGVPKGKKPLKPFKEVDELVKATINVFNQVDPQFAQLIKDMSEGGTLDLESRKAKSPGGFCSFLPVTGLSFIFMNATGTQGDVSTMVHEGGHSVHNLMMNRQSLSAYKQIPMESAELASMGMELLTIDKWDGFYQNEEELIRAKREHIEGIITFFPWAMVVDRFQHWMYENPTHSVEEREAKFLELAKAYNYNYIDISDLEDMIKTRWHMQLHIFEVPFYYIEYAIAQLGALQLWKAYHENPEQTVSNYKNALALGSSKSLPEVYEAAGIKFDFSEETIKELMDFAKEQLILLEKS
jgi:oligoendopeptidase F